MYTRKEFERFREDAAEKMSQDMALREDAYRFLSAADRYHWIHQTNWMGEPVLQLPQDLFILQEIIFKTRPYAIVEVGVAWAGSLLFYATLMDVLDHGCVIGIDTYIPDDLKSRILKFKRLANRIHLIEGSSVADETVQSLRSLLGENRNVMVHLDSDHTHTHVLKELEIYSQFVGIGNYLICGDTIVEHIPEQTHRPRKWGIGNNPATALAAFLKSCDRFHVDLKINNKLLLTCNPRGYLRCIKDIA